MTLDQIVKEQKLKGLSVVEIQKFLRDQGINIPFVILQRKYQEVK